MSDDIRTMRNKIRRMEDAMLRCKNYVKVLDMQSELMRLRIELQRMEWKQKV